MGGEPAVVLGQQFLDEVHGVESRALAGGNRRQSARGNEAGYMMHGQVSRERKLSDFSD